MRIGILLAMVFAATACSGESGTGADSGWQLGDDAGNNAADVAQNNSTSTATNSTTPLNNTIPGNNTTTNNVTNNTTQPTNNATTTPTNNMTMGNGSGVEGDACTVNSACSADLTCCRGFDGSTTCQPQCFGGGLCGGNDAECSNGDVCCDLSGINQPDSCVPANRCPGSNPNPGTPCQNNNECMDPEVCCLGFDGSGECTTQCFTGGACAVEADCRNGQLCCDIRVAMVCLDQCF